MLVDGANRHKSEVTFQPALRLFLRPAMQPVELRWVRFSWGCGEGEALRAGLLQPAGPVRPLAGQLRHHFSLLIMATLLSISVQKSPIFGGRLSRGYAHFCCYILYTAVFLGRLYGNNVFMRLKFRVQFAFNVYPPDCLRHLFCLVLSKGFASLAAGDALLRDPP